MKYLLPKEPNMTPQWHARYDKLESSYRQLYADWENQNVTHYPEDCAGLTVGDILRWQHIILPPGSFVFTSGKVFTPYDEDSRPLPLNLGFNVTIPSRFMDHELRRAFLLEVGILSPTQLDAFLAEMQELEATFSQCARECEAERERAEYLRLKEKFKE